MKNLSSQVEGVWEERLEPTATQLQTLQNGTDAEKQVVRDALSVTPSTVDISTANGLYNQHKPTDENYSLISCDLTIGEDDRGIINCRISGEHKQIRF